MEFVYFLSYCFVTKLLELNPARTCGCKSDGEGDGGCGNVLLSNLEGSFSPNISGIVWMSGESIRRSDVLLVLLRHKATHTPEFSRHRE
jgi:hypothetical protein